MNQSIQKDLSRHKKLDSSEAESFAFEASEGKPRQRRIRTPKIPDELRDDPRKLLEYIFETLCSLRIMTKTFNHDFLTYLIEMAALEAESAFNELEGSKSPKKASQK